MQQTVKLSDGSTLKIRNADTEDTGLILQFIKELGEYEKLSHEIVATEDGLRRHLFGEKSHGEVLIAERTAEGAEEAAPVAFALFFHNFSTFAGKPGIYLEDLFVKPDFRDLGIGKKMLATMAKLAVERGCARFEWSVLDWNKPAIGFYEKLGAKPMSEWTVYRLTGQALTDLSNG